MSFTEEEFTERERLLLASFFNTVEDINLDTHRRIGFIIEQELDEFCFTDSRRNLFKTGLSVLKSSTENIGPTEENLLVMIKQAQIAGKGMQAADMLAEYKILQTIDPVDPAIVQQHASILREMVREKLFAASLRETAEIFRSGKIVEGKHQQGTYAAIQHIRDKLLDVENVGYTFGGAGYSSYSSKEFDTSDFTIQAIEQEGDFIPTGIPYFDHHIGGIRRGQVCAVAGFTGHGKSQMCINMAHSAIKHGANYIYFTIETSKADIRARLIARHAYEEHIKQIFDNHGIRPFGATELTLTGLVEGSDDFKILEIIKSELSSPEMGHVEIVQMDENISFSTIAAYANRQARDRQIDGIVVDSIDLLSRDVQGFDGWIQLMNSVKTFATGFNGGTGIRVITPWQIKTEQWTKVKDTPERLLSVDMLASTSEASRRCDLVLGLAQLADESTVSLQMLKTRSNARLGQPLKVSTNFNNSMFFDDTTGFLDWE